MKLADELAAEIDNGRLKPGDRLRPQRTFAHERGIAASTASRVYAELLRRGLVAGEIGRTPGGRVVEAPPGLIDGGLRAAIRAEREYLVALLRAEGIPLRDRVECTSGATSA